MQSAKAIEIVGKKFELAKLKRLKNMAIGKVKSKDIMKAIKERRSVRAFDRSKKVSKAQIEAILEAGTLAPSARNTQPWVFYVAESAEAKAKIIECMSAHNQWAKESSALIVLMADKRNAYRAEEKRYYIDIGLCLENMLLEVVNQGLGACPCSAFDANALAEKLVLPNHLEPLVIIPIGYEASGKVLEDVRSKYGQVVERADHKIGGKRPLKECLLAWH